MARTSGPVGGDTGNLLVDIGWELSHIFTLGRSEERRAQKDRQEREAEVE